MKILITGGAGFVGRHFTEYFLKQGHEVHVVDSLVPGTGAKEVRDWYFDPTKYERKFQFFKEDCRDFFKYPLEFDLVLHLAAIVGGRTVIEDYPISVADDLSIDSAFWQWAVRTKPGKVITFSSSAAYPIALQQQGFHRLLKEEDIDFKKVIGIPDMSYGWSKLTTEYLGKLAFEKHGIKSVVYRPFSGYGNDQGGEYPFTAIMERVFHSEDNVEVWGTGNQMRDFIHIDDCVVGVIQTMDKVNDGSAINLSTGKYTSFKTLALLAATYLKKRIEVIPMSKMPEGVFARGGNTVKQRLLGFNYKVSLEEGIKKYYESHSNNHD
jgi:GDP-L-fucose synthase